MFRLEDEDGRIIALRLWKRQARTLARAIAGFAEALDFKG